MTNFEKIRDMTPEELTEWLMLDWEKLKYRSTQTYTDMVDWLNSEAHICPNCNKLVSSPSLIYDNKTNSWYAGCVYCNARFEDIEVT